MVLYNWLLSLIVQRENSPGGVIEVDTETGETEGSDCELGEGVTVAVAVEGEEKKKRGKF